MPDFIIDNFQYGLDTRRSELTSKAGTLENVVNLHVNQGGELEKRKAFTRTALPTNSFGLEVTTQGLTVFGSVASGSLAPALPAGFTYQRLQHPDGATAMVSVVSSRSFSGNAWVVAKFADGNVYCYYNGALIKDFTDGLILASITTNAQIAAELTAEVNRSGSYTAVQGTGGNTNKFDVFSLPGATYIVTSALVTAAGTLTNSLINTGTSSVASANSSSQFTIINGTPGGAGVNTVKFVKVNGTDILGTQVDFVTSTSATATAVAAQITTHAAGFTATANGSTVLITDTTASATPNGFVIQVTCLGNVCIGQCVFSLVLASGGTSFNITQCFINGVDVLGGTAITWTGSLSTMASALASAILAYTVTSVKQYAAVAFSNAVYVSQLVTASTDASIAVNVNVSTGGGVSTGTTNALSVALSKYSVAVHGFGPGVSSTDTALVFGGVPPYFYSWIPFSTNPGSPLFYAITPSVNNTTFAVSNPAVTGITGYFVCQVTDSAGGVATSPAVTLTY